MCEPYAYGRIRSPRIPSPMPHPEISHNEPQEKRATSWAGDDLAARVTALEKALAEENARHREEVEREARERHRQFSLLLEELSKAIEKMERRDLEMEKGLRAELTRQNRFIYEEFQTRVARLNAALEEESVDIRGTKADRTEIRGLVLTLLGESTRRRLPSDSLVR